MSYNIDYRQWREKIQQADSGLRRPDDAGNALNSSLQVLIPIRKNDQLVNYPRLWNAGLLGDKLHKFEKKDVSDAAFQSDFKRLLREIFDEAHISQLTKGFNTSKYAAVIYSMMQLKAQKRQNCLHLRDVANRLSPPFSDSLPISYVSARNCMDFQRGLKIAFQLDHIEKIRKGFSEDGKLVYRETVADTQLMSEFLFFQDQCAASSESGTCRDLWTDDLRKLSTPLLYMLNQVLHVQNFCDYLNFGITTHNSLIYLFVFFSKIYQEMSEATKKQFIDSLLSMNVPQLKFLQGLPLCTLVEYENIENESLVQSVFKSRTKDEDDKTDKQEITKGEEVQVKTRIEQVQKKMKIGDILGELQLAYLLSLELPLQDLYRKGIRLDSADEVEMEHFKQHVLSENGLFGLISKIMHDKPDIKHVLCEAAFTDPTGRNPTVTSPTKGNDERNPRENDKLRLFNFVFTVSLQKQKGEKQLSLYISEAQAASYGKPPLSDEPLMDYEAAARMNSMNHMEPARQYQKWTGYDQIARLGDQKMRKMRKKPQYKEKEVYHDRMALTSINVWCLEYLRTTKVQKQACRQMQCFENAKGDELKKARDQVVFGVTVRSLFMNSDFQHLFLHRKNLTLLLGFLESLSKQDSTKILDQPKMIEDDDMKAHERFPIGTINCVAANMYASCIDVKKQVAVPLGRQKAVKILDINKESELRLFKFVRLGEFQNFLNRQAEDVKDPALYIQMMSSIFSKLHPQHQRLLQIANQYALETQTGYKNFFTRFMKVLSYFRGPGRKMIPVSALKVGLPVCDLFTFLGTPLMIPACYGEQPTPRVTLFFVPKLVFLEMLRRTVEFSVLFLVLHAVKKIYAYHVATSPQYILQSWQHMGFGLVTKPWIYPDWPKTKKDVKSFIESPSIQTEMMKVLISKNLEQYKPEWVQRLYDGKLKADKLDFRDGQAYILSMCPPFTKDNMRPFEGQKILYRFMHDTSDMTDKSFSPKLPIVALQKVGVEQRRDGLIGGWTPYEIEYGIKNNLFADCEPANWISACTMEHRFGYSQTQPRDGFFQIFDNKIGFRTEDEREKFEEEQNREAGAIIDKFERYVNHPAILPKPGFLMPVTRPIVKKTLKNRVKKTAPAKQHPKQVDEKEPQPVEQREDDPALIQKPVESLQKAAAQDPSNAAVNAESRVIVSDLSEDVDEEDIMNALEEEQNERPQNANPLDEGKEDERVIEIDTRPPKEKFEEEQRKVEEAFEKLFSKDYKMNTIEGSWYNRIMNFLTYHIKHGLKVQSVYVLREFILSKLDSDIKVDKYPVLSATLTDICKKALMSDPDKFKVRYGGKKSTQAVNSLRKLIHGKHDDLTVVLETTQKPKIIIPVDVDQDEEPAQLKKRKVKADEKAEKMKQKLEVVREDVKNVKSVQSKIPQFAQKRKSADVISPPKAPIATRNTKKQ